MAPEQPGTNGAEAADADFAKAFQELAKGEQTATALESQLSKMEDKINALLAQAEKEQKEIQQSEVAEGDKASGSTGSTS